MLDTIKLMLVEDDSSIRGLMARILQCEGFEVVTAADGQDALNQLERMVVLPDLIILDLMMPVVDGWGFRKRQLSNPRLAPVPTVVITAGEQSCWKSLQVKAEQLIPKKLELDSFLATVLRNIPSHKTA